MQRTFCDRCDIEVTGRYYPFVTLHYIKTSGTGAIVTGEAVERRLDFCKECYATFLAVCVKTP